MLEYSYGKKLKYNKLDRNLQNEKKKFQKEHNSNKSFRKKYRLELDVFEKGNGFH